MESLNFQRGTAPTYFEEDGVGTVSFFPVVQKDKIDLVHLIFFPQLWDDVLRMALDDCDLKAKKSCVTERFGVSIRLP